MSVLPNFQLARAAITPNHGQAPVEATTMRNSSLIRSQRSLYILDPRVTRLEVKSTNVPRLQVAAAGVLLHGKAVIRLDGPYGNLPRGEGDDLVRSLEIRIC